MNLSKAAAILGREGGKRTSERKTLAVRENAKKPRPNARGKRKPRKTKAIKALTFSKAV